MGCGSAADALSVINIGPAANCVPPSLAQDLRVLSDAAALPVSTSELLLNQPRKL